MSENTIPEYGAIIERGRVVSFNSEAGTYTVASIDRNGITTPEIPCLTQKTDLDTIRLCRGSDVLSEWSRESDYTTPMVGDLVFFFLFRDGTGRVICKL